MSYMNQKISFFRLIREKFLYKQRRLLYISLGSTERLFTFYYRVELFSPPPKWKGKKWKLFQIKTTSESEISE